MLHKDQIGGVPAAESMPNKRASPASATISSQSKNMKIDRSLVKLVCKNYLPFTFLESDSFQKFVLGLNRSCLLPTRKILSTVLLDNYYAAERARIMAELTEVDYVALTIDGWTSAINESYLSITAHFINNSTELKSYLLDSFQYSHKQTGENLKERIEPIFREWSIKDKIVCVTSSNSYDAVEMAIRLMGVNHVSCFAYILNRVVMTALVDIENIKTRIKRIVQHFKCSPSASKKLKYMQVMLGKEEPKLVNDVMPMWISTYEMFQRVITVKDSLIKIISQDYPQLPQLNNQVIDVLINTNKLLAIFKNVLEEISSEKKVSASEVIILVNVLINKCQAFLSSYSTAGEVKNMARTLVKEMRFFFGKIEENKMFAEATILDPRFKEHSFKNQFVCDATVLNIKQLAANVDVHPDETNLEYCNVDEPKSKDPLADSIWDDFDRDVQKDMGNHCATTDAMIETDKYLQEPMLKRMQDPLKWWHENRNTYPRLYELVKKRMCIAATSLLSERLFSKTGNLISYKRNRLSGRKVSKILFLNYNM